MPSRLLPALLVLFSVAAQAEPAATDSLQLNGFGSLGMTRSSNRNAAFVRDLNQPKGSHGEWRSETDSLLGLQANWQMNPQ